MYELLDKYCCELFNTDEFKRLMELKNIIDKSYYSLIIALKTNEDKYNELKQYGDYAIGLNEARERFMESKTKLYSKPEVKEYFLLEGKIQAKLNSDINELKEEISNKFKPSRRIIL